MNKEILSFSIYGQYLKRKDYKTIANKARNVLLCKFEFKDTLWNGEEKFALFKNRTDTYNIPLGNNNVVDCIVPWEVLTGKYFRLTVYGGDLITTNEITIPLVKSGYTTDITPTREPSKDVFVEIIEELKEKIDDIVFEENALKLFSNGELRNIVYLPYVDEEYVQSAVKDFVTLNDIKKFEFNEETGEITFEK